MGLFQDRVVVVTGAGGGIGRAHALAFAREGAAVVVNDLGSTRDGTGASHSLADQVVKEIEAAGGRAAASYDSVATWEGAKRIVDAAVSKFGRLDILVNNAGILRDKTLLKMDEAMWDLVIAVHLKGTFLLTRFAAEVMAQQVQDGKARGGRIVNTTSLAGLKGNFGQTNYAAAKAGIYGVTIVTALELKKHGITVNAVAPMAKTRLTEDIAAVPEDMKPEQISPMVLYLASDLAQEVTGRVFGIHGQRLFEYRMEMSEGVEKPGDALWTAAEIHEAMPRIEAFAKPGAGGGAAAAAAALDTPTKVDRLVKAAPRFFVKERAGTSRSNFHLVVKGARNYTIRVEDGACTVLEGLEGKPTCTIKTDADTYVGMAEGKVNPQKAFMEQKLTADNLPEAMKYGTTFRPPKPDEVREILGAGGAAAAAAPSAAGGGAAAGPAAEASPKEIVKEIFRRMPEAFVKEKAGSWKAAILWKVQGAGDFAVEVENGDCRTHEGPPPKATCTVKVAADTLIGMVQGKVNAQKAFMEGKISADNLQDMMKFGAAFDLKKGAAAAERAQAAAAPPAATAAPAEPARPAGEGLNRSYVGRSISGGAQFAKPEHMKMYALATNDPNPHYLDESRPGGIVAPPLFVVRLFKDGLFKLLTDPGLNADLLRLVHGEQDMRFHRPIRPWDLVTVRAAVDSIEDKSSGQVLRARSLAYVEGELAMEATSAMFIRGTKKGDGKEEEKAAPPARPEPVFRAKMKVADDQTHRYAEASLDDNPIHVDAAVAKMAGLPGMILQGLCTMAFTSRAIVQETCAGDPTRLKRLAVRFSKPVLPGDELETAAWKLGPADGDDRLRYGYETTNQAGAPVITNGLAEVRTS